MSGHNRPGSVCSGCDRDSTVTTSNTAELDTYDQLLVQLLSVEDFISCSVFHRAFHAHFNVLLDQLSEAGLRIPYVPPSEGLIRAVPNFVNQLVANKHLLDGIVSSTGACLSKLSGLCP